ncbi:MAG: hypothetical protein IKL10_11560 [Clostridia bacterium]|nr:hypothetical protein [Clostridia bacterium]
MSGYSYQDMMRMQSEAKQRVLEMQKRSRSVAENFNDKHRAVKKTEEQPNEEELPRVPKAISYPTELQNSQHRQHSNKSSVAKNSGIDLRKALNSVFGNLSSDEYEKMFILSLCLLLSKENHDDSLIFALMYLLT